MSETALPNNDAEKIAVTHEPEPVRQKDGRGRGTGLAILALLLGVGGLAAGGWSVWQMRQLQAGHQQQSSQVQELGARTQALQQNEQQLSARLSQLPPAQELEDRRRLVTQLQSDQQRLNQRLESVLGASRKDWRLAEAEHLLRLASLRLSALQDINSATALVEGADEILRQQDDPGAFAAREQLAKSLAALRATEQPDRTGLFLQLSALRDQTNGLSELAPAYKDQGESLFGLTSANTEDSYWSRWWNQISRYFRVDFNASDNVRPLLAGQSLSQVRLALSLAIEQAQWAALNGEAEVYKHAIDEAKGVLGSNFNNDNPQSRAMSLRLEQLAGQPVSVMTPDLAQSLASVQAYLERRHAPADSAGDGAEAARP